MKVLIVEKNDNIFKQISSKFEEKEFEIVRVNNFQEAKDLIESDVFQHIVCHYQLTDKLSFDFIGAVKELSYNHANLLLPTEDFLKEDQTSDPFDEFLYNEKTQKKLDEILDLPEDYLDHIHLPQTESYLKFADDNFFTMDKTYLFDYNRSEIYIGLRAKPDLDKANNKLSLNLSCNGKTEQLLLNGSYSLEVDFDNDKDDIVYLAFKIDEQDQKKWLPWLEMFEDEGIQIEQQFDQLKGLA